MLLASLAGPAFAASKKAAPKATAKLAFSPREPFDNQPITVTWKADHGPRHLYEVYFTISTGDHQQCGSDGYVKPKRTWKKGSTVRVTFTPRDEKVWCPGDATVYLVRERQDHRLGEGAGPATTARHRLRTRQGRPSG